MTEHTPGPWHATASNADGTMITSATLPAIAIWPQQGGTPEQCANVRLIALAPELLAALESVIKDFDRSVWTADPMLVEIRALIAKAKGDSTP